MKAGARALADGEQARQGGAPVEVGRDPANQVVGGGRDRHRLALRVEPGVAAGREDVREAPRLDRARSSRTWSAPSASIRSRIAAVTWSRGASSSVNRRPLRPAASAPSPAHGLGDQGAVVLAARQGEGGGVELAELEVGELGAGGVGEHRAGADRAPAGSWCAPQRRAAAGRQHRRRRGDRAAVGDHPGAALAVAPQRDGRAPSSTSIAVVGGDQLGEPAGDRPAGLAAARVDDPPRRVPALEAERELAVGLGVEAHAAAAQLLDRRRRLAR